MADPAKMMNFISETEVGGALEHGHPRNALAAACRYSCSWGKTNQGSWRARFAATGLLACDVCETCL